MVQIPVFYVPPAKLLPWAVQPILVGRAAVSGPNAVAWVWWFDSGVANHFVSPPLSPKEYCSWENSWHLGSVHTARKFLWTVSPGAVDFSLGRKGPEAGTLCNQVIRFCTKLSLNCNPATQPILNVVPNTWAFQKTFSWRIRKVKKKKIASVYF